MRATGIVRRVDDLGRIVIPKEIRRSMGIKEGEPLEIFLEGKDTVCFRKYLTSASEEVATFANKIIENYIDYSHSPKEIRKHFDAIIEILKNYESEEE